MPNMTLKKNLMPSLDADYRNQTFDEVALGLSDLLRYNEYSLGTEQKMCNFIA